MFKYLIAIAALLLLTPSCAPTESTLRSQVVKLVSARGSCSGEQVRAPSGADYILSAGHCKGLAVEGSIKVIRADGSSLERRVIAEDPASDLLLLEGLPGVRGMEVEDSIAAGTTVHTLTHGRGFDAYFTEGVVIQETDIVIPVSEAEGCAKSPKYRVQDIETFFGPMSVCVMALHLNVSTAAVVPGSSGGAVLDSRGRLVGVVSATDGKFGYFVTPQAITAFLAGY